MFTTKMLKVVKLEKYAFGSEKNLKYVSPFTAN
jgi:hypothetical protein